MHRATPAAGTPQRTFTAAGETLINLRLPIGQNNRGKQQQSLANEAADVRSQQRRVVTPPTQTVQRVRLLKAQRNTVPAAGKQSQKSCAQHNRSPQLLHL